MKPRISDEGLIEINKLFNFIYKKLIKFFIIISV